MDSSFGPKLYYRHSGQFSAAGLVVALLVGLLVGLPCAWLYAWLIHWNPFIYINLLASLGFGAIVGLAAESSLVSHKCRNVPLTGLVAFAAIALPYYVSWAVWLHALLHLPAFALLLHPAGMWQIIVEVNKVGAWTLRGSVVNGIPLWITWILEAGFIIGAAVVVAVQTMQQATYCEGCDRFAKTTTGACYAGAGQAPPITEKAAFKVYQKELKQQAAELKQHLENKDLAFLEQLGAVQPDAIAWYQFDLVSCPQCSMTNTLRVLLQQNKVEGKKIRTETTQTEVLRQLLLSSSEAESLRRLGEKLSPLLPRLIQQRARQAAKAASAQMMTTVRQQRTACEWAIATFQCSRTIFFVARLKTFGSECASSFCAANGDELMRIHEGTYAYDLEQLRDPQTQLPLNWKFTVYRLRPVEKIMCTGEAESREDAETKARNEIAKLESEKHRPAA